MIRIQRIQLSIFTDYLMRKIRITLLLVLFPLLAVAQNRQDNGIELLGSVYDEFLGLPLESKVYLLDANDNVLDSTESKLQDNSDIFSFRVPHEKKQYIVELRRDGYGTSRTTVNVKGSRRQQTISLGYLYIKKKANIHQDVAMDNVTVTGTKVQVIYRGDTIIYNASAFVLPQGSMLKDLVAQLPNTEIDADGNITVQGKHIDYLTINGKNLFKGKNSVILNNLPYFTVKDVRVYHKDKTGMEKLLSKDRQKDYVMDVTFKKEYLKSVLANIEAGLGTSGRHMARLFAMTTGSLANAYAFANSNNINESGVPSASGDWSPDNIDYGIRKTNTVGGHIDIENKKHSVSNEINMLVEGSSFDESVHSASEIFAQEGNINRSSFSSRINSLTKTSLDHLLSFGTPKIMGNLQSAFQYNNQHRYRYMTDSTFQQRLLNISDYSYRDRSHSLSVSSNFTLARMFAGDDMLIVSFGGGYDKSIPDVSENGQRIVGLYDDYDNYYTRQHRGYGYNMNFKTRYHYNITNKLQLTPYVDLVRSYTNRMNMYYTEDENLTAASSYNYGLHQYDATPGFSFNYNTDKNYLGIDLPFNFRREHLRYNTLSGDTTAIRNRFLFEPGVEYETYGKNKLSVSYHMKKSAPELYQLMPYTNAIDPLSVDINNAALKMSTVHTLSVHLTFRPDSVPISWYLGGEGRIAHNAIGTRVYYNENNASFAYVPENVGKPNWNMRFTSGFNYKLDHKHRLSLIVDAYYSFIHNTDFDIYYTDNIFGSLDERAPLSDVNTSLCGLKAELAYRYKTLSVGVSGKVDGQFARSDRDNFDEVNIWKFRYGAYGAYSIPSTNLTLSTDIYMYKNLGYDVEYMNRHQLIWNATASYSFLKGLLTAKVQAYDILKDMSNRQYIINAQGRTESWYNSIPRYLMFSLAVTLGKKS